MKSRMSRRHKSRPEEWVEAADKLAHDIATRMSHNESQLEVVTDRAHPRQTNPRRVARIMSEGEIDKAEAQFERGQSEGDREKLIGAYQKVTGTDEYKSAMETKRTDAGSAMEERRDLMAEQNELGQMNDMVARNRYDLMSAHQAGLEEFPSSKPVNEAMPDAPTPGAETTGLDGGKGVESTVEQLSGHQVNSEGTVITPGNFDPNDSSLKNEGLAIMGMGDENEQPAIPSMDDLRGRSDSLGEARDEAMDEAKASPSVSSRLSNLMTNTVEEGMSAGPQMDRASETR